MLPPIDEIHPLFIHFPIALFSSALLFDALGFLFKLKSMHSAAYWNLILGLITSVFAVITGFIADSLVGHMEEPFPFFSTHGTLQIGAMIWLTGILYWRITANLKVGRKPYITVYLVAFTIGVLMLFYGAHLGAHLANRI